MENENNVTPENFEDNTQDTEFEVIQQERAATQGIYDNIQTDPFESSAVHVETVEPKKKSGKGFWIAATAVLLIICIISTSVAAIAINDNGGQFTLPKPQTPEYAPLTAYTTDDLLTVSQVYAKVEKSVVDIIITTSTGGGFATGIIYTTDGYIVTNAHVVDTAKTVTVRLVDGTEYPAEIIGFDSYTEVAVLKIEAENLVPAEFGESSKLVTGEQIVAIGTPYDITLTHTTSDGIVSAIRNDFTFEDLGLTLNLIQHTASINPGNSGGPLLNMYGQVIGINTIKIVNDYENIGFAIQIESVLPIVEQLMNNGKVERPQIGISGYTEQTLGGVVVASLTPGGAAEKSELKVNDIITKIDGVRVKTIEELITRLGGYNVGDTVVLSVLRDVDVLEISITLQKASEE
ncbi:MAG: trypsin-like peptidase domain-containing protein [Clostridia bacterium]|nr:trypsin-like peptidase domain-containing protein [Clostridia bacterium]